MIASIPSPSFNSIDIGPLSINLYGLCIALGVVAAVWLFGKRLEERQAGTRDDAAAIAVWAVLAGVIGARLYHVATDWDRFEDNYESIPAIWEGGLGIPGGLLFGIPVGLWMSRRREIPTAVAATAAAPAIPLAQAIGRWGNYFNQELYGRPTDLPWALEIDPEHLEPGYAVGTTFQPTFLYESLWTLGLALLLIWIDRRWRPAPGQLMVMYLIGYGIGRFWIEGLRIDPADEIAGLRWNQWVAAAIVVVGVVVLVWMMRNPLPEPEPRADFLAGDDVESDDELDDDSEASADSEALAGETADTGAVDSGAGAQDAADGVDDTTSDRT